MIDMMTGQAIQADQERRTTFNRCKEGIIRNWRSSSTRLLVVTTTASPRTVPRSFPVPNSSSPRHPRLFGSSLVPPFNCAKLRIHRNKMFPYFWQISNNLHDPLPSLPTTSSNNSDTFLPLSPVTRGSYSTYPRPPTH